MVDPTFQILPHLCDKLILVSVIICKEEQYAQWYRSVVLCRYHFSLKYNMDNETIYNYWGDIPYAISMMREIMDVEDVKSEVTEGDT